MFGSAFASGGVKLITPLPTHQRYPAYRQPGDYYSCLRDLISFVRDLFPWAVILHQCRRLLNTSARLCLGKPRDFITLHVPLTGIGYSEGTLISSVCILWGWSINTLLSREGSSFINSESPTVRARDDKVFPIQRVMVNRLALRRRPFLNLFRPGTSNDLFQLRRLFFIVSRAPMGMTEKHVPILSRFNPKIPEMGFFLHASTHIPTGYSML